jgi:hypothetical protein
VPMEAWLAQLLGVSEQPTAPADPGRSVLSEDLRDLILRL